MKYYKFLYFILFSFIFNFNIISQNNPKEILNVINDGQEEVILYDDKSWEFASVVTRKNILKTNKFAGKELEVPLSLISFTRVTCAFIAKALVNANNSSNCFFIILSFKI